MKQLVLLLLLASPAWGNQLVLEFAQEGDPAHPRALIVVHDVLQDRESFKPLFAAWANGSWGRDQFCSVYSYEYDRNDLDDLISWQMLGEDLYKRIERNDFHVPSRADSVNPFLRTVPTDSRQPLPSFNGDGLEILLVGYGYGGLVARQATLLSKKAGFKVTRVAYVGTPLDGLSTIDLMLGLTTPERSRLMGLEVPIAPTEGALALLSPAWWSLTHLYDEAREWPEYFAPALQDVTFLAAYGGVRPTHLPVDNVLYGRHVPLARENDKAHDGFLTQPVCWGRQTGPVSFLKEVELELASHGRLTDYASNFVLKDALQKETIYGYLVNRQVIEEFFKAKVGEPPLYQYWDEREGDGGQPQWRGAYASRKALYEMMWGVAP